MIDSTPLIRQATTADAAELARLRWTYHYEENDAGTQPLEEFSRILTDFIERGLGREWAVWVAEHDGRLICNMYVQIVVKVPRPGRPFAAYGYISNVYTAPAWRSRGVGGLVPQALIAWARERQLAFLVLWPSEATPPFYERHGFIRSPDGLELHLVG